MDDTTRYRVNKPSIVNEIIDGEVVMINLDTGSYYSADKTGAVIWAHLANGATLRELVDVMIQRYEGAAQEIEKAVSEFLERLRGEKLIAVDAAGGNTVARVADTQPGKVPFNKPVLERYDDMQDLLLADPIHDVNETGWPPKVDSSDKPN